MTTETKIHNVLLVDDDANIRLITEMTLEGLTDWKLRLASGGAEALKLIDEERPDLVLLDIMMPDMDGMTVFSEIKKRLGADTPFVIFMTAKVQTQEVAQYTSIGAAGVIMKPFDPMTLPNQIMDIVGLTAEA